MRVWLTSDIDSIVEVWLRKPVEDRNFRGQLIYQPPDGGEYGYAICGKVFRKITNIRLKPGECRCVDLRLSIKPIAKRKKVKR